MGYRLFGSPATRVLIRVVEALLIVVGFASFVFQDLAARGVLGEMRSFEWPVGRTSAALRLPDGRYAVPLEHLGRVQVYDSDLKFQYGWRFEDGGGGGVFTLLPAPGGNLQIYTARGKWHHVFSPDGTLLSTRNYDYRVEKRPESAPTAIRLQIPTPWWTFPVRNTFYAWITGVVGMALLFVTTKNNWPGHGKK